MNKLEMMKNFVMPQPFVCHEEEEYWTVGESLAHKAQESQRRLAIELDREEVTAEQLAFSALVTAIETGVDHV